MTTDRDTAEAIAFRKAYQLLVDNSPEAPDTLLQATVTLQAPVPATTRRRRVIGGGLVGLGVVLSVWLGVIWLGQATSVAPVATTEVPIPQAVSVPVLRIRCVPERLDDSTLSCVNAIDNTPAEFISPWQELTASGVLVSIELTFPERMVIEAVQWSNIEDRTRFLLHHRARSISIQTDNNPVALVQELADTPGTQQIQYSAIGARTLQITVTSTWPSETVEGSEPFDDLSIVEIAVLGYPAP
jgi:hypothetical protein